ncbi:Fic family protein [Paenibacillus sp. FSL W8-1187]|uniref:Fic family protein n=1 Tax=Paenibacillus sp. FSL W8-1187 TaxID=2975339 RepID=UPI0030D75B5C
MYRKSSSQSKYCYPGTDVLINIPGFQNQEQLTAFENLVATYANLKLIEKPLPREHFSRKSALLMADLNHLHPFREGNGRSLREFIRCLALRAGYSIDWRRADSKEILLATIESVTDESHLEELIYRCISKLS